MLAAARSVYSADLVHQRHTLITSLHEAILRRHNDLARKVVQREEQARHGQADEARGTKQAVQEDSPDNEFNRGVWIRVSHPAINLIGTTHVPNSVNRCHANSLTRSTSVVMSVMICALLEKSSSSLFSSLESLATLAAAAPFSAAAPSAAGPEDEAMSLRTSVLAYRIEFSCTLKLTCRVVVERDHSWPVTTPGFSTRTHDERENTTY